MHPIRVIGGLNVSRNQSLLQPYSTNNIGADGARKIKTLRTLNNRY